jgi:hypothetical protein
MYLSTFLVQTTESIVPKKETKSTLTVAVSQPQNATFIQTFLRTPFALVGATLTLFTVVIVGFLEFWGYLLSGFNYQFPITNEIIDIGWKGIIHNWWFTPGIGWHLIVSSFIWLGMFSRKRKKSFLKKR